MGDADGGDCRRFVAMRQASEYTGCRRSRRSRHGRGVGMIAVSASDQRALHVYTALPYIFGNVYDHRNRDFQALC